MTNDEQADRRRWHEVRDFTSRLIEPFRLGRINVHVLAAPAPAPVTTSFGVMHERPAVLVKLEDEDGVTGWGEAWCNFPLGGASHRANLICNTLAPMIERETIQHPSDPLLLLTDKVRVLTIQTGEEGPFAQSIAAIDQAMWNLVSRRLGQPLWRVLGGVRDNVPVYASGINPIRPEQTVARVQQEGFSAFKLKVGFDGVQDIRNLAAIRDLIGMDAPLMADANQAWSVDVARARAKAMEQFKLDWLEEPLLADSPEASWRDLDSHCSIPLAGGENIRRLDGFENVIASGIFDILQPDLAKWGGISGCLLVARTALRHGLRFCPHYLGGGVGLLASAHLLAASGGDGLLEVDINENPLRTQIFGERLNVRKGRLILPDAPGIGLDPDPIALSAYAV